MEESLRTESDNLQRALKEKEESLQSRISEVNDLKSKIDVLAEQVSQAELAVSKTRGEAATIKDTCFVIQSAVAATS